MSADTMPAEGPLRDAYIAGATAEARIRTAPREAAPKHTRQLLGYLDAVVEHQQPTPDAGELLTQAVYVFRSTLTRADRRAIRRALRGRR